jgi:signal-transduction protein with cAMP-binding, CBS, and nucleotidyltransferase domain
MDIVTIDECDSIQHAAALMRDRHVGALVVTREEDGSTTLSGVVTDRDVTIAALASGVDAGSPVGPIATGTVVVVPTSTSVAGAVTTMREAGVRRLVLVDRDHQLAGLVSLDDVLAACAEEIHHLADAVVAPIRLPPCGAMPTTASGARPRAGVSRPSPAHRCELRVRCLAP